MTTVLLITIAALTMSSADIAAGKKLHTGKCARCHKLYDPAQYDDSAWETWMTKMRKKTKLDDERYRQLTAYTQTLRTK